MTVKLFDEFAYLTKFEAKVIDIGNDKVGDYIVLDKSLFFPEEGGQTPDLGTVNGVNVTYVKRHDDNIYHYVENISAFFVNETVTGEIDWNHRYSNMQMHSGEHIFSGLVFSHFGYNNVGFHLSDNSATMDYNGKLSREDIQMLEDKANRCIYSNIPIVCRYPSDDELSSMTFRLKKELTGPIRIVSIEGVDTCACCAPHVKNTGEIGLFKITSFENYKGGTRVHYLAGFKAFLDYRKKSESLKDISECLSSKEGEEVNKVKDLFDSNRELQLSMLTIKNKIISDEISKEFCGQENGVHFSSNDEISLMKYTMESMHRFYKGTCFVFAGSDAEGYRYFIENDNEDLTALNNYMRENLNSKGGGKPHSIQGTVSSDRNTILTSINQWL